MALSPDSNKDNRGAGSLYSSNSVRSSLSWLQTCLKEHKECPKPRSSVMPPLKADSEDGTGYVPEPNTLATSSQSSTTWFPKRLIEINPGDENLHIIETSKSKPAGPYGTLSHCWGKQPNHLVLTVDNLP